MKKFATPVLVEVTDLAEGVYASSGAIVIDPTTPPSTSEPEAPWNNDFKIWFQSHNNGSKSYIRIKGQPSQTGDRIKFTISIPGATLAEQSGDVSLSNYVDGQTLVVEWNSHYNVGQGMDFLLGAFTFNNSPCNDPGLAYYPAGSDAAQLQQVISPNIFNFINVEYF